MVLCPLPPLFSDARQTEMSTYGELAAPLTVQDLPSNPNVGTDSQERASIRDSRDINNRAQLHLASPPFR
uniref:Uncharacterized protein n=1 Tax=Ralstonia syzygii R24 TaxID=907261 RepID=G3A2D7_9RALS|nr:hypothetical protein RALSY_20183 [Ralstonia syzygii R24]